MKKFINFLFNMAKRLRTEETDETNCSPNFTDNFRWLLNSKVGSDFKIVVVNRRDEQHENGEEEDETNTKMFVINRVSEGGKVVQQLTELNNVFSPEAIEILRLDFKPEDREKFYVEKLERCLDRDTKSLEKQQVNVGTVFSSCHCKKILECHNSCLAKVVSVQDNQITKIFEPTERFTEENLRDRTFVLYKLPQKWENVLTVNLFDIGTQSCFGFPFLVGIPAGNISYAQLYEILIISGVVAKKSERVSGEQIDNWWNRCQSRSDVEHEELEGVSSEPEEVSFDVHKSVLIARSEVFQAMLTSPTSKESISNRLIITDIKPNIVDKMLQFIYTDNCIDIDLNAVELFIAADKYFLNGLKIRTANVIRQQRLPKFRQALRLAAFGELYNNPDMVENAIKQVLPSLWLIIKTEEWKDFSKIYPALAIKILTKAMPPP